MTIRFIQTVPSEHPDFPFVAGQVIDVACPSPLLMDYLKTGAAEAVRVNESERAVAPIGESAEPAEPPVGAARPAKGRHGKG